MGPAGRPSAARLAAAAVHVYTASGVVLALLMVHFAYAGRVRAVLWLFLLAMVVDGTDGLLSRRLRVKEVLPGFDGALLDNIVDYLTYAFAPMVLLWSAGYLPTGWLGAVVASAPLLASCYQFCRTDAKTEDHFFLGFPSYWNVAAFYLIVPGAGVTLTTVVLLVLSALVFVPVKYLYPSRTETWRGLNMALAVLWLALYAVIVAQLPGPRPWLVGLSAAYLGYYAAASLYLTLRVRRRPDEASVRDLRGSARARAPEERPR